MSPNGNLPHIGKKFSIWMKGRKSPQIGGSIVEGGVKGGGVCLAVELIGSPDEDLATVVSSGVVVSSSLVV